MTEIYTGCYPLPEDILGFTTALRKDTQTLIASAQHTIAARHNAFVDYVLSLMLFATGHRPVTDPFCYLADIDIEQGWILIDDKVLAENRRFRLAALPPMARKQLEAYLIHLKDLSFVLQQRRGTPRQAGYAIAQLFSGSRKQILPLFFHLSDDLSRTQSVTRKTIDQLWKEYWHAPPNFGRKYIATELAQRGVNAHMIRIQIGHAESVDHPMGRNSTTIPKRAMEKLSKHLEDLLVHAGWRVIPYRRKTRQVIKYRAVSTNAANNIHESQRLGPEQRYRERMGRLKQDKDIVDRCIRRTFPDGIPSGADPRTLEILANFVAETAKEKNARTSRCLLFLYRYLKRFQFEGKEFGAYRQTIVIPDEGSPFDRNTVTDYAHLIETRKKFITYLADTQKQQLQPSLEVRLSELIVSSMLFGFMASKKIIERLPEPLLESAHRIDDLIFVDIPNEEHEDPISPGTSALPFRPPEYRWYPDDLSRALLTGLHRQMKNEGSGYHKRLFDKSLNTLLKNLLPKITPAALRFPLLLRLSKAAATMELPGFLRTYVQGKRPHTPLPQSALIRLITGRMLEIDQDLRQRIDPYTSLWLPKIPVSENHRTASSAKTFLKSFHEEFTKAKSLPFVSNRSRNQKLRHALAEQLPDFISSDYWPTISLALAGWVFKLCKTGTEYKRQIAFSTVEQYTFTVANPLSHEAYRINFLSLSEEEYEEIYIRALTYSDRKDVLPVAKQFKAFHHYLTQQWSIEEPDWSVVYLEAADLDKNQGWQSNASILTEEEYCRALEHCFHDEEQPPLRRYQHMVLLVLGYRFHLRFGECYKAQLRDIQLQTAHNWSQAYFLTRNSIYGNLKTLAAVRHIPLTQTLTNKEINALNQVMDAAEDRGNGDIQSALMAEGASPRNLIDRFQLSSYLNQTLKAVTGDPQMRFHQLRRSGVNKLIATSCMDKNEGLWKSVANKALGSGIHFPELIWGGKDLHCKRLQDIAVIIGHVDVDTTLAAYTHLLDIMLLHFDPTTTYKTTNNTWAYALGITENAAKKRVIRHGNSIESLLRPDIQLIPVPALTTVPYKADNQRPPIHQDHIALSVLDTEIFLGAAGAMEGNTQALSKRFFLPWKTTCRYLQIAQEIEQRSGYTGYRLSPLFHSQPQIAQRKPAYTNQRETRSVRAFLESLKNIKELSAEKRSAVKQLCELWIHGYYPGLPYIYLPNIASFDTIIDGLSAVGLTHIGLECILNDQNTQKHIDYCNVRSIAISNELRLSKRGIKADFQAHIQVGCRFTDHSSILPAPKALHRVLFVLSCAQRFRHPRTLEIPIQNT